MHLCETAVWVAHQSFWGKHGWKHLFNAVSRKGRVWCRHSQGQGSLVMLQEPVSRPEEQEAKPARASHGFASRVCPGNFTWSIKAGSFLPGVGPVIVGNPAPCARALLLLHYTHYLPSGAGLLSI